MSDSGADSTDTLQVKTAHLRLTPNDTVAPNAEPEYILKKISFSDPPTCYKIITQNHNGPCPLIAICNVLILQDRIHLPFNIDTISFNDLIQILANCLIENQVPDALMQKCFSLFPKLQIGLDVNVRFDSVDSFGESSDLQVFQALKVRLVHGWTVDPQDFETFRVVVTDFRDYNRLVQKVVTTPTGDDTDRLIAEQFINENATQMTYHGLLSILETLNKGELAVLFRNNHFSTILKKGNRILVLVTDIGYQNSEVVWETLDNLEGDSVLLDSRFLEFAGTGTAPALPVATGATTTTADAVHQKSRKKSCVLM